MLLAARAPGAGFVLELDGRELGPASEVHRWHPTPGRHLLAMRGAGRLDAVDAVAFEVRGALR